MRDWPMPAGDVRPSTRSSSSSSGSDSNKGFVLPSPEPDPSDKYAAIPVSSRNDESESSFPPRGDGDSIIAPCPVAGPATRTPRQSLARPGRTHLNASTQARRRAY